LLFCSFLKDKLGNTWFFPVKSLLPERIWQYLQNEQIGGKGKEKKKPVHKQWLTMSYVHMH